MIDVRVQHPDYAAAKLSIMAARDCFLGERAVKQRADLYLPRLSGQSVDEYAGYKMRATFYSIVGRTVAALTGLAIQGEVSIKGNEETVKQMKDAPHGMQLFELNVQTVAEILLQGRWGLLLDAPAESNTVGIYGYVSDSIWNWALKPDGSYLWVILHETRLVQDVSNPYKQTMEDQYRLLSVEDGVYSVQLFDKDSKPIGTKIVPKFMGKTIDYIPFFTAMPDGLRAGVSKSPMEDMVNVNLSHYRTSADLENGRHFVGLPTPVVTGTEVSGKLRIGSSTAWILPDKDAKAFYMEFEGQGLQSLETALEEKEKQLSSLSSSIVSRSISGSESPDAIRLRMSSETASLFSVVQTTQSLMNKVYNVKSELEGNPQDIELVYPTQFVSGQLSAEEVKKYSEIYLSGGMPLHDYVNILRRGGALSAGRSDEDVKAELQAEAEKRAEEAKAAVAAKSPTTK